MLTFISILISIICGAFVYGMWTEWRHTAIIGTIIGFTLTSGALSMKGYSGYEYDESMLLLTLSYPGFYFLSALFTLIIWLISTKEGLITLFYLIFSDNSSDDKCCGCNCHGKCKH